LSADGRGGEFNGMSHSGIELSISNRGPACTIPALPVVAFLDRGGVKLSTARQRSPGNDPAVARFVRLGPGQRAAVELRWVSGPVFPRNKALKATKVAVQIGKSTLKLPISAKLYGPAGRAITFEQSPAMLARTR
jgi:hypothetical protein